MMSSLFYREDTDQSLAPRADRQAALKDMRMKAKPIEMIETRERGFEPLRREPLDPKSENIKTEKFLISGLISHKPLLGFASQLSM